jgi:tetratricopeptide (TPR) repeat protein
MTREVTNFLKMAGNLRHSASIELYLSGEMEAAEKAAFELELKNDPELREELRFSKMIDAALTHEDQLELRAKLLKAIEKGKKGTFLGAGTLRMRPRTWYYAAASLVALFAIAATLYFNQGFRPSNEKLFTEYYSSENVVDLTRGDEVIVEAVIKFQQKDFRTSSELFRRILNKDNSNIAVWFYYGISNIETANYDNAIKAFNTIIAQNDNLYIEHAQWYLGLCYLKNNQNSRAIGVFTSIAADPDNFHRQEARKLLEKLQLK